MRAACNAPKMSWSSGSAASRSMPRASRSVRAFWFGGDDAAAVASRDALIREQLEPLLERAARGEFASWAASPKRRLALIILFDQVPRNTYRGTAAAFAFDREALALAVEGMQLAADAALEPVERIFFYLPLEHAESMEAQEAAVPPSSGWWRRRPRSCATTARTAAIRPPAPRHHCEVRAVSAPQSRTGTRQHAGRDRMAGGKWRQLRPVVSR